MATSIIPGAYVRIAEPHEYAEVAWILTRGFARDPCMNWLGSVREMIPDYKDQPDYDSHPASAKKILKNLFIFQSALVKATSLCGGFVTVAIIPPQRKEDKEILAATTLWLKPKQPLELSLSVIVKSKFWKILLGWGFTGAKRIQLDFSPIVETILKKRFKARNADVLDSWYLLEVATDPAYDGKGLCSLLMKDGLGRTSPKPIHLEASTSRTRDIYSHFGFEIEEECWFGKGSVDVNGLAAKGKAATGYPEWIMTKHKKLAAFAEETCFRRPRHVSLLDSPVSHPTLVEMTNMIILAEFYKPKSNYVKHANSGVDDCLSDEFSGDRSFSSALARLYTPIFWAGVSQLLAQLCLDSIQDKLSAPSHKRK
ncbi:hypothetical protein Clacol_010335 [Clathrus columnatus]|uniref:N-acetyltransferase domain-containing protein n=1 Tax=Clathrus columnatus TaxID=1419009 RepID=A0AAV5AUR3_9AGAM|nr:hypothetical protein Clacol_010335 [Clathrus columnatus]